MMMNRLACKGLTALTFVAAFGLGACAATPLAADVVDVGPARFAAPTPVVAPRPMVAAPAPVPRLNLVDEGPSLVDETPTIVRVGKHLNCVEFARVRSGVALSGNAGAWWDNARGHYERDRAPAPGAVMVFSVTRKMRGGHVAVVKKVLSEREILIDHANWMNDGRIYLNARVVDVSDANDWSKVRVWNGIGGGQMGNRVYPIKGFVAPSLAKAD
jgi:hypothetical protein